MAAEACSLVPDRRVAFEELAGRLLVVARRVLHDEDDARDALQDGFLSAFRALGAFQERAQVSTWLHRIVVNAALMKLRARRRRPEEPLADSAVHDGYSAGIAEPAHVVLERREMRRLVRSVIAGLPELQRRVLVLRDVEELDTEETARALGISAPAVKSRLHRARHALRARLRPYREDLR